MYRALPHTLWSDAAETTSTGRTSWTLLGFGRSLVQIDMEPEPAEDVEVVQILHLAPHTPKQHQTAGGGIRRQSSAGGRSMASSGKSSPSTYLDGSDSVRDSAQKIKDLEDELERAGKNAHIVESVVHPGDVTATWEDAEKGFHDWRQCYVDGSHLKESEGAVEAGGMQAAGAQGEVLRATWKSSIKVAIKKNLNPEIDNENELKLFIELHHPHVVACYGILKEVNPQSRKPMHSIVTERCRTSLEAFLQNHEQWKDKKPSMLDMMKYTIIQHIALGLQKLHDMNVLHRDIKANNILLDGAPGTCPHCDHSGNWKICDFGEASVLRTPMLVFSKSQPWPRGWSDNLTVRGRFQPITSPYLHGLGARHYCWLKPGEKLQSSPDHDEPPTLQDENGEWMPCEHGGFVYSFSDDPSVWTAEDCFFGVEGGDDKAAHAEASFPAALGPFSLNPTELLPKINWQTGSYRLRKITHRDPQLEKLKDFGVKIEGKVSPIAPLTLGTAARRAVMIPKEATHFVWAYQGVDLDAALDAAQASQLDANSPEVNFVSLGGFVYLKEVEFGDDPITPLHADVCRATAIALEGSTCRAGTISRAVCGDPTCNPGIPHRCPLSDTTAGEDGPWCDNGLTASIASPELFDGLSIGLETDIYAFGVVMWEVFTRRQAWEWFTGKQKDQIIMNMVMLQDRRPRMPDGLNPECAKWVRRCLHKDPPHRPAAKEITGWINECRKAVEQGWETEAANVSEQSMRRGAKEEEFVNCAIMDKTHEHWSKRGRFSLHTSRLGDGLFHLQVVECTLDQWMENALVGDEEEPEPLQPLEKMKNRSFGLKFEEQDGHGGKVKTWPVVSHCEMKDKNGAGTIAAEFPSITPGCCITKINGQPAPRTFKAASPKLKERPLALEFTIAVAQSTEIVKPWLRAGLLEIGLVRRHETAKLLSHRKQCDNLVCNLPHCGEGCCGGGGSHEQDSIRRTNSHGWIKLAQEQTTTTEREKAATEREKAATDRLMVLQKRVASMAAKDAFRDAIALVRAHEDKSIAATVATGASGTTEMTSQPEPQPETSQTAAAEEGVPPTSESHTSPRWRGCLCPAQSDTLHI